MPVASPLPSALSLAKIEAKPVSGFPSRSTRCAGTSGSGSLGKFWSLFGGEMDGIIGEMNEILAA